jgi:A/G-specific adenine glycosylase
VAAAPLSRILEYWIGLGYNRRARFLHETCKIIENKYDGIVPWNPEELDAMPGIGPYTARAISTFAFSLPNVFIETNIRAVYIFFFFPDRDSVSDPEILDLIDATLYRENPRLWYYALMDYGAVLKKKVVNPNRKSAHYSRQSRFQGSLRQARGAIVRYLDSHKCATFSELATSVSQEYLENAARALVSEGLVFEKNGVYFL